jgi:hypothetical protein
VTAIPDGATITGQRKLEASLYELRLGPYPEARLWKRLSVSLSAGAAIARLESAFEFAETAVIADGGRTLAGVGFSF